MVRYLFCAGGNNSVVECDLAKVEVAGSNPVSRSIRLRTVRTCRASVRWQANTTSIHHSAQCDGGLSVVTVTRTAAHLDTFIGSSRALLSPHLDAAGSSRTVLIGAVAKW